MAYAKKGYPTELANKVGHIKLIQDPLVQETIKAFEDLNPASEDDLPPISGHLDLNSMYTIKQVVTVDGSHQPVPNLIRPETGVRQC